MSEIFHPGLPRRKPSLINYPASAAGGNRNRDAAVRTSGNPDTLAAGLGRISHHVDPRLSIEDAVPFTEMDDRTRFVERTVAHMSAGFGALALVASSYTGCPRTSAVARAGNRRPKRSRCLGRRRSMEGDARIGGAARCRLRCG